MYESSIQIRVRYGETDQMSYVYYGNYALYYEEGRTHAIRAIGVTYKSLEAIGIMMPVMEFNIQYLRPAFYDELLTVKSQIRSLAADDTEVVFHSEIYNEAGKKVNQCQIKLAFVDAQSRRKTTIPDMLYQALKPYFES